MSKDHLNHKHAHTLQQIFQHPASHNLQWHDVVALVRQHGTVEEGEHGHMVFAMGGVTEVFNRSQAKDVAEVQQVLDIRHFLEKAGLGRDGAVHPVEHAAT